jgi:hypothetical protein
MGMRPLPGEMVAWRESPALADGECATMHADTQPPAATPDTALALNIAAQASVRSRPWAVPRGHRARLALSSAWLHVD